MRKASTPAPSSTCTHGCPIAPCPGTDLPIPCDSPRAQHLNSNWRRRSFRSAPRLYPKLKSHETAPHPRDNAPRLKSKKGKRFTNRPSTLSTLHKLKTDPHRAPHFYASLLPHARPADSLKISTTSRNGVSLWLVTPPPSDSPPDSPSSTSATWTAPAVPSAVAAVR
jgi:hypothetical protein